jgi:Family of unknown function (DUF6505)
MKFPRCIRLDTSDTRVFPRAAAVGEWAVPGGLTFAGCDPETLDTKTKLAFRTGWLGTDSFGWSSLVEVAELGDGEFEQVVERLAAGFVSVLGAADLTAARAHANAEAKYAAALCDHDPHTLLALERHLGDEGIVERIRVIVPERAQDHARIWEIVPDDDPDT